jgi:outer membrane protein TolC
LKETGSLSVRWFVPARTGNNPSREDHHATAKRIIAKDNQRVVELEEVRYRVGARDLRSVSQQQLALYAARMTLLRAQSEQRIQRVNLYLALGGSFGETAQLSSNALTGQSLIVSHGWFME